MKAKYFLIILCLIMCSCKPFVNKDTSCIYTLENVDCENVLYKIDIKTYDSIPNWTEIDSKIKTKFDGVDIKNDNSDSLFNLILEELPERPKEMLISF